MSGKRMMESRSLARPVRARPGERRYRRTVQVQITCTNLADPGAIEPEWLSRAIEEAFPFDHTHTVEVVLLGEPLDVEQPGPGGGDRR